MNGILKGKQRKAMIHLSFTNRQVVAKLWESEGKKKQKEIVSLFDKFDGDLFYFFRELKSEHKKLFLEKHLVDPEIMDFFVWFEYNYGSGWIIENDPLHGERIWDANKIVWFYDFASDEQQKKIIQEYANHLHERLQDEYQQHLKNINVMVKGYEDYISFSDLMSAPDLKAHHDADYIPPKFYQEQKMEKIRKMIKEADAKRIEVEYKKLMERVKSIQLNQNKSVMVSKSQKATFDSIMKAMQEDISEISKYLAEELGSVVTDATDHSTSTKREESLYSDMESPD